jgi:N-acetylglucosaminyl-diphospho-decaprenol L-rhamnosyltransferase
VTLIRLSIIIVSYNCRDLLAACIDSIKRSGSALAIELIVVDNASIDDTVSMLHADYPDVITIANPANDGFSVANNIGMRIATADYCLLLNPDTELTEGDMLDDMVKFLDEHPQVGAVGGNLRDPAGNKQVSAGYRPTPLTLFAFSFFLAKLTGNRIRGLSLLPGRSSFVDHVEVDWICGACMMVRREVLETSGMLNESYFMYGEDIEWGCRITADGWTLCHLPAATVTHVERGTQQQEEGTSSAWVDGMARVYMELNPGASWVFFKYCLAAGLILRAVMYGAASLVSRNSWPAQRRMEMATWLRHLLGSEAPANRAPEISCVSVPGNRSL